MVNPIESGTVTDLLILSSQGDSEAQDQLFKLIYNDLHAMAHRVLQRGGSCDLQTTDLLHESLLRFQDERVLAKYSNNRRIFFSVAIRAMQQVMIDHYRRRKCRPDTSARVLTVIDQAIELTEDRFGVSFESLAQALAWLEQSNPRQYAAIAHRFFGGLTTIQTAELLNVTTSTVERDCRLARARLLHRLRSHFNE